MNKKTIAGQESQLFEAELEKFRPHQNRLLQANHKQASLMKELTKTYGDLLQDKRVRAEQSRYETITRQRNTVMARYKKVYDAFNDLLSGLAQAQAFYTEMSQTVDSLKKNVETFINNRRSEGAQLLSQIERERAAGATDQEDREREKLRQLMERLSTDPSQSGAGPASASSSPYTGAPKVKSPPPAPVQTGSYHGPGRSPNMSPHYPPAQHSGATIPLSHSPAPYAQYMGPPPPGGAGGGGGGGNGGGPVMPPYVPGQPYQQGAATPLSEGYNPMAYPYQTPVSPPPTQQYFSTGPTGYGGYPNSGVGGGLPPPLQRPGSATAPQYVPPGYVPPPPPPPPPPSAQQQTTYPPSTGGPYPSGPGGYAQSRPYGTSQHHSQHHKAPSQGQAPNDPWAGLNAWK